MSLRLRAAAYAPNGARLGILPTPQGLQGSMVLGDVGAFSISYPTNGPKAPFLSGACEVALEVSYDDGQTWTEPNDARYLRLRRKGDQVDAPDVVAYEGPSYLWLLDKSPILPEGALDDQGKRPFLTATVGTIIRTVVQEAQARGELPGLDVSTFSAATDSSGAAWGQVITIYYEPGVSALTILRNLSDQGMCDFTMAGRSLRIYKPETVMGGASGATLLKGRDLTEAPYQATLEGIASHAYLLGDGGLSFERTNPTAPQPWGRWTAFISQGGVSDTGTMTVLTDAALSLAAEERVENTYGLDFSRAKALPFRDYTLGKTVKVSAAGAVPEALRLRQVTLTRDERGTVQGNVVLNDRFLENEVRQSRRISGITGGSTADGGSGSRPDDGVDRTTPKAPTGLTADSTAYLDDEGRTWALVNLDWADVTQNTDNTAITDLAGYEVQWSFHTEGNWVALPTTETSALLASGFQPNTEYDFRVRAFDNGDGRLVHRSGWSGSVTLLTEQDATAPGKPSTPTVSAYLGQLLIDWDGLLNGGGTPPTDFDRVEVYLSTVNGFAPSAATLLDTITSRAGGTTVATGLTYATPYYVKFRMYDRAGNVSVASDQATATPERLVRFDLDDSLRQTTASVWTWTPSLDRLGWVKLSPALPESVATSVANSAAQSGGYVMEVTGGRWWSEADEPPMVFDPNVLYRMRIRVRRKPGTGSTGTIYAGFLGYAADGVTRVSTAGADNPSQAHYFVATGRNVASDGSWEVYEGFLQGWGSPTGTNSESPNPQLPAVAHANVRYFKPLIITGYDLPAGDANVWQIDRVEIEATRYPANIIGRAQIADLAVNSAKINDMAASKITAGAISAAITVSGRIATALTGARVELNSTGLKAYNSGGVNTVAINTDGSATVTGLYRTAASGRRLEISDDALGNNYGADGQHSLKWTPTTLTSGWTPSGVFAIAQTVSGASGNGTLIMSSNKIASPFTGSSLFLGMNGVSMDTQPIVATGGSPATFTMTPDSGSGSSVYLAGTDTSLGDGGSAGTVSINAGLGISLNTSAGNIYLYERASATEALAVRNDGTAYVRSQTMYARTSTAAVNMTISSFGTIARSTSLERYKVAIDREWADKVDLAAVKGLTPASYYDRQQAERFAAWVDPGSDLPDENVELPRLNLGLIAEDVERLGLLGLTNYDDKGNLTGVAYERVAVALIPWLRDLERRLEAQERRQEPVGSTA